jgi:DNA invertase Pin-like site-specific DNA recombinase
MRVALYARVSTRRQAQAQTVEQQLERLAGHARQQGWDVPPDHIFRDDGHSGASLRRPGLDRLRDRAAARALDLVVIAAPDRLARNYVHQVLLLEELEGHGCAVRFLDRPMSRDPHDQLLLQIRGAVAEYERTLITERMRRGRQRRLEAGLMLPWTRPPFGYRVDPDRPRDPAGVRVEEAEAAVVREMFAWYAEEAHSFCSLARAAAAAARDPDGDGAGPLEPRQHPGPADQPGLRRPGLRQPLAPPRHARAALGDGAGQALGHEPGGRAPRGVDPGGRDPAPRQPGTVRSRAGATGQQPPLRAAQQQGPSLPAAQPGQLRALRPGLPGPDREPAALLLLHGQAARLVLAPGAEVSLSPEPGRAAGRAGVGRPPRAADPPRAGHPSAGARAWRRLAAAGVAGAPAGAAPRAGRSWAAARASDGRLSRRRGGARRVPAAPRRPRTMSAATRGTGEAARSAGGQAEGTRGAVRLHRGVLPTGAARLGQGLLRAAEILDRAPGRPGDRRRRRGRDPLRDADGSGERAGPFLSFAILVIQVIHPR